MPVSNSIDTALFSKAMLRTMPGFKSNVSELRDIARRAPKENKDMIHKIIELYVAKKI